MRHINKGKEPEELTSWKKANPNSRYEDLDRTEKGRSTRQAIRRAAIKEQFGLCGYCCIRIDENTSSNEHVISQQSHKNQTLNFDNIIASCNKKDRCNQQRGSRNLQLTPLMPECETELKFYLSGKVKGETTRAKKVIEVLALDNKAIREERKNLVDSLLYEEGAKPDAGYLKLLEDELLNYLVTTLDQPDDSGILPPYSPVLINIIRGFLNTS